MALCAGRRALGPAEEASRAPGRGVSNATGSYGGQMNEEGCFSSLSRGFSNRFCKISVNLTF